MRLALVVRWQVLAGESGGGDRNAPPEGLAVLRRLVEGDTVPMNHVKVALVDLGLG